jgi:3-oxoacyl-[acyl-carrier protein] reductase
MDLSFGNKVALITVSSRGIGAAIARKFALAGTDVVLNYLKAGGKSQEQGELLCREIQEMGQRACLIQADMWKRYSVRALQSIKTVN